LGDLGVRVGDDLRVSFQDVSEDDRGDDSRTSLFVVVLGDWTLGLLLLRGGDLRNASCTGIVVEDGVLREGRGASKLLVRRSRWGGDLERLSEFER
jgi:hypothetical protein